MEKISLAEIKLISLSLGRKTTNENGHSAIGKNLKPESMPKEYQIKSLMKYLLFIMTIKVTTQDHILIS